MQSSSPSHGDKEEEKEELAKAAQAELQRQLEAANLFDATLHIHQAVPAKDTAEGWVGGGSGLDRVTLLSVVPLTLQLCLCLCCGPPPPLGGADNHALCPFRATPLLEPPLQDQDTKRAA